MVVTATFAAPVEGAGTVAVGAHEADAAGPGGEFGAA